ncbi:MAG: winged helix-turn-helix domain-containing protein [Acidobacteriota bacterium]
MSTPSPPHDPPPSPSGYRFEDFVFTLDSKELRRGAEPVTLQRQPARALELLLERAGDVVTREELRRHLWGDEQFVDHEQGINFTIRKIRIALDDAPSSPTFIETLPRRGYRFLAPVEAVLPVEPVEPAAATPGPVAPRGGPDLTPVRPGAGRRLDLVAAAALIAGILALTAALVLVRGQGRTSAHGETAARVAVADGPLKLAVAPLAADSDLDDEALAVVIGEELTSHLTHTFGGELDVIGMRPMRGVDLHGDIWRDALARTEATHVLHGTVSPLEDGTRIALRLVRRSDDVGLWAQTYEPRFHERARNFDESAWQIAQALGVQLDPAQRPGEETLPPEVQEAYSRALYLLSTRRPENILGGVSLLLKVCEEAPNLARAHTELAKAYMLMTGYFDEVHWHQVERVARRAVELDDSSAEAHLALATALFRGRLDWRAAEERFERALELSPKWTPTLTEYALYLSARHRHDEARASVEAAVELDRYSVGTLGTRVLVHYFARRHAEAADAADGLLELFPTNRVAGLYGPLARLELGEREAALRGFRDFLFIYRHGEPPADLNESYRMLLEQWQHRAKAGHGYHAFQAAWLSMLGEEDEALEQLRRACGGHVDWLLPFVDVSPMFDPIRGHPDYGSLGECLPPEAGARES